MQIVLMAFECPHCNERYFTFFFLVTNLIGRERWSLHNYLRCSFQLKSVELSYFLIFVIVIRNNEVQFAGELQPRGCCYRLEVPAGRSEVCFRWTKIFRDKFQLRFSHFVILLRVGLSDMVGLFFCDLYERLSHRIISVLIGIWLLMFTLLRLCIGAFFFFELWYSVHVWWFPRKYFFLKYTS